MKKIFVILTVLIALFSFTACEEEYERVYLTIDKTVIEVGEKLEYEVQTVPVGEKAPAYSMTCPQADVLNIDADGVITGRNPGSALLYARIISSGMASEPKLITVVPQKVYADEISIVGPDDWGENIYIGKDLSLNVITEPGVTDDIFTWSSSNPDVIGIDSSTGRINGFMEGSSVITVTSQSGKKSELEINCIPVPNVTYLEVINPEYELVVASGDTVEIKAKVLPGGIDYHLSTTNESAVIDGHFVTVKDDTTVNVDAGNEYASVYIQVANWKHDMPTEIDRGQSFLASVSTAYNEIFPVYRIEDPEIAVIDGIKVMTLKAGTTKVIAEFPSGARLEHEFTVLEVPDPETIEMDTSTSVVGRSQRLDVPIMISPANADYSGLKWGGSMAEYGYYDPADSQYCLKFWNKQFPGPCDDYDLTLTWNGETQTKKIRVVDIVCSLQGMKDACKNVSKKDKIVFGGKFDPNYGESGINCLEFMKNSLKNMNVADLSYITNESGFDFPFWRVTEIILPRRFREKNLVVTNSEAISDFKITYNENVY